MTVPGRAVASLLAITFSCLAVTSPARAERADRDQPIGLEADRVTVDDRKKVAVFEGHVRFTQGSLLIQADRIVVTQDADKNQKGVATGTPARFHQKREGKDEFIDGQARRIEHDTATERTEFFGNAVVVRSNGDEVRGQYIRYDAKNESYVVNGAREGTAAGSAGARVHAVIQPRHKADQPAAGAAPGPKDTKE